MDKKEPYIAANRLYRFLKEQKRNETGAFSKGVNAGINIALAAIRNEQICPVEAVEVVHGRWSPVTYGLGVTVTRWMCSNCKKYENSYGRTNYCPNCGAKMDGGE